MNSMILMFLNNKIVTWYQMLLSYYFIKKDNENK